MISATKLRKAATYASAAAVLACSTENTALTSTVDLSDLPSQQQAFFAATAPEAARIEAVARSKGAVLLADAVLAHAALESNWGTSELTRRGNNYFGITCSKPSTRYDCVKYATHSFRHYPSVAASFDDYESLITSQHRYRFVAIADGAKEYFYAIQDSKYAEETDMGARLSNRYRSAPFFEVAGAYRLGNTEHARYAARASEPDAKVRNPLVDVRPPVEVRLLGAQTLTREELEARSASGIAEQTQVQEQTYFRKEKPRVTHNFEASTYAPRQDITKVALGAQATRQEAPQRMALPEEQTQTYNPRALALETARSIDSIVAASGVHSVRDITTANQYRQRQHIKADSSDTRPGPLDAAIKEIKAYFYLKLNGY